MKGRIIGREGRNIHVLEQLTGVDIIVDDTPSAVRLSSFDGMRREVARLTLERLIADGRIHPSRCEEAFEQATREIEERVVEEGERATLDANVNGLHPRADRPARQAPVPHQLRPERARPLVESSLPRRADRGRARRRRRTSRGARRCCTTSARRSTRRSRGRTRRSAPASPAATARARRSPTRSRPTTTRSSRARSRRSIVQAADASPAPGPGARGDIARGVRGAPARPRGARLAPRRASRRSTRCRPAARCGSWSIPARSTTSARR